MLLPKTFSNKMGLFWTQVFFSLYLKHMLSVTMLSIIILNVIMLSAVAPLLNRLECLSLPKELGPLSDITIW
jgi:hypothetical protein